MGRWANQAAAGEARSRVLGGPCSAGPGRWAQPLGAGVSKGRERTVNAKRIYQQRLQQLTRTWEALARRRNPVDRAWMNGLYERYQHPVLTRDHVPLTWRYDLNPATNPLLIERMGVNAIFNPGAMLWNGKFVLVCRIEGYDRKSFFAIAESDTGVDRFRFWDGPMEIPETDVPDTNVYDMRLIRHEDGWIYGLFCTERKDRTAPAGDTSSAVAQCAIVRTRDLLKWERLPDLRTASPQQRNVVLHPEFVNGRYALYTRPQEGFMDVGHAGGIGWGLIDSMEHAALDSEEIIEEKVYHTIKESKNGLGPAPIRTAKGWLHVAHGVRNTAAGLRYVLYAFLCDLKDPSRVIRRPGGHLIAPLGAERVGDVSNVLFSNGMIERDGDLFIYYASSDTRIHVATTSVERMLDYVMNTPEDGFRSYACVQQRKQLIARNAAYMAGMKKNRRRP